MVLGVREIIRERTWIISKSGFISIVGIVCEIGKHINIGGMYTFFGNFSSNIILFLGAVDIGAVDVGVHVGVRVSVGVG